MGVRYRRAARAVYREAHGNVYVLPPSNDDIAVLRGAGTAIWHAFTAEPKTADEVVDELVSAYDVPADVVIRDVHTTMDDLTGRGLLVSA